MDLKEQKKFSVIIPCYNLGNLLPKAINSVLVQTLDAVEIIVVDDASDDAETLKILEKLEEYVQVIYLEKNSGVSVARNTGIKSAKSEYILCLDADDTIEPTYLEKAKNIFDADEKIGIVSCGLQSVGVDTWTWKPKDYISIKEALAKIPVHTASCFRKVAHDDAGGYDEKLRGYEDWDHWLRIMKLNWVVRVIPEYLFNYYVRPGSKVETSNKHAFDLTLSIIKNHKELYEKHYSYVIAKKQEELAQCYTREKQQAKTTLLMKIVRAKKKFFPGKFF